MFSFLFFNWPADEINDKYLKTITGRSTWYSLNLLLNLLSIWKLLKHFLSKSFYLCKFSINKYYLLSKVFLCVFTFQQFTLKYVKRTLNKLHNFMHSWLCFHATIYHSVLQNRLKYILKLNPLYTKSRTDFESEIVLNQLKLNWNRIKSWDIERFTPLKVSCCCQRSKPCIHRSRVTMWNWCFSGHLESAAENMPSWSSVCLNIKWAEFTTKKLWREWCLCVLIPAGLLSMIESNM